MIEISAPEEVDAIEVERERMEEMLYLEGVMTRTWMRGGGIVWRGLEHSAMNSTRISRVLGNTVAIVGLNGFGFNTFPTGLRLLFVSGDDLDFRGENGG